MKIAEFDKFLKATKVIHNFDVEHNINTWKDRHITEIVHLRIFAGNVFGSQTIIELRDSLIKAKYSSIELPCLVRFPKEVVEKFIKDAKIDRGKMHFVFYYPMERKYGQPRMIKIFFLAINKKV